MMAFSAQGIQVIIPMAGLGTRLLPLTKSVPKSMMPLVDKPALHHVVEEALRADINNFCFIVNEHEQATIEHYFSHDKVLETVLKERKKIHLLAPLNNVIDHADFTYVVQDEPRGLGHAVLMGESSITPGSFFCVMLPDNIIENNDSHMARIIALSQKYNATVITVEEITQEEASHYALVTPGALLEDGVVEVVKVAEKVPSTGQALCLGQIGRHVLSYDIFESLKLTEPGVNGEIQLTDAVQHMIEQGKRVIACTLSGKRHDIGNTKNLLRTTVIEGLRNPLYKEMLCNIFQQEMQLQDNNR